MLSKTEEKMDITQLLGMNGSSGPAPRRKRWSTAAIIAASILLLLVIAWLIAGKSAPAQYKTQEARRGNLTVTVTATGTLYSRHTVSVGIELSGVVQSVAVDYNDRVKKGQVLARLDTSKLEAQLIQSKAALESAKAKTIQTQATVEETKAKLAQLKRVRELSNNKVPSQLEMDSAGANFERAEADAASASAAVSQAQGTHQANELDLSKAVIRSPINGIVLTRSIEPGQTVAASYATPILFTLAEDLAHMELHVNIDEADVGKVEKGQHATFSVAAYPSRTFEARITQVRYGSSTTSGVVTYETVLNVDNPDLALRPGMTATADIVVQKIETAMLVPAAALRFTPPVTTENTGGNGGLLDQLLPRPPQSSSNLQNGTDRKKQQVVWTLQNGKPGSIAVTTGATDGLMTEVTGGDIREGMKLLVERETTAK
jgi:HlyD family secretion protein